MQCTIYVTMFVFIYLQKKTCLCLNKSTNLWLVLIKTLDSKTELLGLLDLRQHLLSLLKQLGEKSVGVCFTCTYSPWSMRCCLSCIHLIHLQQAEAVTTVTSRLWEIRAAQKAAVNSFWEGIIHQLCTCSEGIGTSLDFNEVISNVIIYLCSGIFKSVNRELYAFLCISFPVLLSWHLVLLCLPADIFYSVMIAAVFWLTDNYLFLL